MIVQFGLAKYVLVLTVLIDFNSFRQTKPSIFSTQIKKIYPKTSPKIELS